MTEQTGQNAPSNPLVELAAQFLQRENAKPETDMSSISIRDYFAAAALSGLLARDSFLSTFPTNPDTKLFVEGAFALADECMRQRNG